MKKNKDIQQIYGYHSVKAALNNKTRLHKELFILNKYSNFSKKYQNIVPNIQILEARDFMKKFGNETVNQGILLITTKLKHKSLDDYLDCEKNKKNSVIIILDQVTDPQNIGSIMRSCALFNCGAVIVGKNNSPELTSSLIKAASGAIEKVEFIKVTNLQRAIKFLKKNNYWIYAMDSGEKNSKIDQLISNKSVFVLGAEGKGIREIIKKECDDLLTIPISKNLDLGIDSLNVSNASSIILYEYYKKYF